MTKKTLPVEQVECGRAILWSLADAFEGFIDVSMIDGAADRLAAMCGTDDETPPVNVVRVQQAVNALLKSAQPLPLPVEPPCPICGVAGCFAGRHRDDEPMDRGDE